MAWALFFHVHISGASVYVVLINMVYIINVIDENGVSNEKYELGF